MNHLIVRIKLRVSLEHKSYTFSQTEVRSGPIFVNEASIEELLVTVDCL